MRNQAGSNPSPSFPRETTNRRGFLAMLAAGAGAALLVGCGTKSPPSAPTQGASTSHPTQTPPSTPTAFPMGVPPTMLGLSIFRETMVEMAWPAIKAAAERSAVILLPVGIIEEHGPHLGLGVDIIQAYATTRLVRLALEPKGVEALIAPPCYWGMSPETENYPGTFSVRGATMKAIIYDVHACLHAWGFKYVFSFNAHGSSLHNRVFQETIQEAHEQLGLEAYYIGASSDTSTGRYAIIPEHTPLPPGLSRYLDVHAGAFETAAMQIMFPATVDTALAKTLPASSSFDPLGYWGSPADYDKIDLDELTRYAEASAEKTAQAIAHFLNGK